MITGNRNSWSRSLDKSIEREYDKSNTQSTESNKNSNALVKRYERLDEYSPKKQDNSETTYITRKKPYKAGQFGNVIHHKN